MTTDVRRGTDPRAYVARAWWSLLGFVVTFGLAFAIGEGIASALGHPPGGSQPAELWVMLVASVPALVVFVLPAVAAVHFGRRAMQLGDPRGRYPAVVAIVVAGGFVLLNVVSGVGVLLSR
ncbi:hypothetical protein GCM10011376_12030 [Nocardioides flavus (ex Wang et al. 2016)]|uniref:Integral membrane protein n=1 Tax=Nocardioides flavus (ex Wang et al. 2016) TaxID=2058780 RepID=A0ABQ3HI82_9ACTN|nr:hypothetical protein [Nocardioides flavus (ex Wang et al. 2016)]GHE16593.1 hypothetical protein GCM10011376_12030 [Nocardioides flavus (ex Wang et al. 2016)]